MVSHSPLLIVVGLALTLSDPSASEKPRITGMYSTTATPVFDLYFEGKPHEIQMTSPDKKSLLAVNYESDSAKMVITLKTRSRSFEWKAGVAVGAEIGVYLLDGEEVKIINVTPVVLKVFGQPFKCDVPEPPNLAGIKWLKDSHLILVAAEVVNHSNCDSNGTFNLYAVSVPDLEIVRRYDQLEAKKSFRKDLGRELRPANDECIRHPKSCELEWNHRDGKN